MEDHKTLRNAEQLELKQANHAWANCISKAFLPQWLKGENVNINEVCTEEYEKMRELDAAIYEDHPMPFKSAF